MTEKTNPYQPVGAIGSASELVGSDAPHRRPFGKVAMTIWALAYGYPLLAVSLVYSCWLVAWVMLGHQPRPMLDDPKYIGGAVDPMYFVSMILLMAYPIGVPCSFIASFFCPAVQQHRLPKTLLLFAISFADCVFAVLLVRFDPGSVFEWYFD